MNITYFTDKATTRHNFSNLDKFFEFASEFTEFILDSSNYQAEIVCRNENNYLFYQFKNDGNFNITRPINKDIWINGEEYKDSLSNFKDILLAIRFKTLPKIEYKHLVAKFIYTIQQSVGASLDALPSGRTNTARKLNGDIFENLIRLLIQEIGIDCLSGVVRVPIFDSDGIEMFKTTYQHDLLISQSDELKIIGSVKTSSKDRIDKIFVDKFLYSRLTGTDLPHVAIFLNDVQRGKRESVGGLFGDSYRVSSTFLPGKFKAYTIKLNPLDGVYYCDLRPAIGRDTILKEHIKSIDEFFYSDLQALLDKPTINPVGLEVSEEETEENV